MSSKENLKLNDVQNIALNIYKPFAEIKRAISWPGDENGRMENDAEHSYSLALVGMAIGERLGLNSEKIAYYAIIHDLPELYADDTSVWDDEGQKTKKAREKAAIERIEKEFTRTPILARAIHQYESLADEEARFVYSLDKLLAIVMVMSDNGKFWKDNNITYARHLKRLPEGRAKIVQHPTVLQWLNFNGNFMVKCQEAYG